MEYLFLSETIHTINIVYVSKTKYLSRSLMEYLFLCETIHTINNLIVMPLSRTSFISIMEYLFLCETIHTIHLLSKQLCPYTRHSLSISCSSEYSLICETNDRSKTVHIQSIIVVFLITRVQIFVNFYFCPSSDRNQKHLYFIHEILTLD